MIFKKFFRKLINSTISNGIYEIVEETDNTYIYTIRVKYFRSKFKIFIEELVNNKDILFNLPSIQTAYIGYEYSKFQQENNIKNSVKFKDCDLPNIKSRYEFYEIVCLSRNYDIVVKEIHSGITKNMDPRDVFLSKELLVKFDPAQAYFIGVYSFKKYDLNKNNPNIKIKNNVIDFTLKRKLKSQRSNYIGIDNDEATSGL